MAKRDLIINADLTMEQKVLGLLICTGQELKIEFERRAAQHGLSFLQLNILHALDSAQEGRLTVNDLKAMLVDESPNVSRTLNKLVNLGLVQKERSTIDQRIVYVSITENGRRKHEVADEKFLDVSLEITDQDLRQLYNTLLKI